MKKIFIIAVLALANCVVSCSNDAEMTTPPKSIKVNNDSFLSQKPGDTITDGGTGGQGGQIPPKP